MVGVEHLAGVPEIQVVGGLGRPGQFDQPLEVSANDAVLGRRRGQLLEARELAVGGLARVLGEVGCLDALAQLVDLCLGLVRFAELALNCLQLLAQVVLALTLLHLRLDLGLDP